MTGGRSVIEFVDEIQEQLAAAQREGELPAGEPETEPAGEPEAETENAPEAEPGPEAGSRR